MRIDIGEVAHQLVVERIARLLVPAEAVSGHCLAVGNRGGRVEAAIGVDREPPGIADHGERRLDPAQVLLERRPADLHLERGVAHAGIGLHLVLEAAEAVLGIVVSAGGIDRHALGGGDPDGRRRSASRPARPRGAR